MIVFELIGDKLYIEEFSVRQTLFCGQTFGFSFDGCKITGVINGKQFFFEDGEHAFIYPVAEDDLHALVHYFDLDRDYAALKKQFSSDVFLSEGISYASGMRVLNQPPFETLISFIISANNNVKRITLILDRIRRMYGTPVGTLFAFPTPGQLLKATEADYMALGCGYRARYLESAVKAVAEGFDLDALALLPYTQAKKQLCCLMGVGCKVADCVLLYSLGFKNAFPMDVWMKRVVKKCYGIEADGEAQQKAEALFGECAGIAQQYLFHYARNHAEKFR